MINANTISIYTIGFYDSFISGLLAIVNAVSKFYKYFIYCVLLWPFYGYCTSFYPFSTLQVDW